jgi:3-phenylpropionate/trans-cinnamate dioxygenase ferredoxin subunit
LPETWRWYNQKMKAPGLPSLGFGEISTQRIIMPFTKVATLSEIQPDKGKQIAVGNRKIALFNVDGKVFAIDDTCPHRGGPLHEGICANGEVTCPWHAARFDLATGSHLSPPARTGVQAFPVQIVGDEVQIDI